MVTLHPCAGHLAVSFCVVLELEALCVCTAEGAVILLHLGSQEVEQVGQLEGGIVAAAWSPEGAALLVLTGTGRLLLMNQVHHPPIAVIICTL